MNIPSMIKIEYNDYKVNLRNGVVIKDEALCFGKIDYRKCIIDISTDYAEDVQKCTFIHECLHGIDEVVEAELTEDQVRLMAKGLYSLIKNNPNIFK